MSLRTVRTVDEARAVLGPLRLDGRSIGLVATMGALHEGHLSLIAKARAQCDVVVVSLFVNPAQFNEHADLERYPRQEEYDRELAERAGADVLFAPSPAEIYPPGFSSSVAVLGLTDRLEGAVRGAAHFRGVTTVVTKLLNILSPDIAYFGQKDAQQTIVIRRLVEDLNMAVDIEVCPTVREPDGLAMSSRNAHLTVEERARALALPSALAAAEMAVSAGERSADALLEIAAEAMSVFEVEPEYLALVSPDTLEPVTCLERPALLAVAARLGSTRLIDNATLDPTLPSEDRASQSVFPARLQRVAQHAPAAAQQTPAAAQPTPSARSRSSVLQPAMRSTNPNQANSREAQATCSA
jgi:pantoate--beta-alanine ligase